MRRVMGMLMLAVVLTGVMATAALAEQPPIWKTGARTMEQPPMWVK